ncbi:carboxyl-terminal processing protease CtpB [Iningainema tapete]|uniref:C-terminal processing peptidase n=1 Tax=Iningainema tapete BLCC-T55 TaxID=2748662 RepID=A0A8J7BZY9_9CYAN|nr:carboxyl-terminal processing protease CtpB [Iningainema tapete]MBD2778742.1 S41 family peptidase [Iningainema tapete BLCC-T55]
MHQFSKSFSLLQVAFISGAIATTATLSPVGCRSVRAELKDSPKVLVDQVWQLVNSEYVDGTFNYVDWQATRQSLLNQNYTSKEQAYAAIQEALKQLGDPYTRFLEPKQYQALTEQSIIGQLSGIGIQIQQNPKTNQLVVAEAIENSPALKAGIKAGDKILAIDGKPTQGLKVEDASKLIRGKLGTPVTLKIERLGKRSFNVKITRGNIEVPKVSYTFKQEGSRRVGYIRLAEFSATAPQQMRRAIQNLKTKQVDGFVLDLRGNGGGLVSSSVEIARMWLDNGAIVRTENRKGTRDEIKANKTAMTEKPLVVLVDGNSASASEILTGALKDNKRAVIVGSQTFGKGLVQLLHKLPDGSGLAVTIERYFTPNGTDINHKGIKPDVKIDLTRAQIQQLAANPTLVGTRNDPQYARAIAVLINNNFTALNTP